MAYQVESCFTFNWRYEVKTVSASSAERQDAIRCLPRKSTNSFNWDGVTERVIVMLSVKAGVGISFMGVVPCYVRDLGGYIEAESGG
jgi:hypothetical protein